MTVAPRLVHLRRPIAVAALTLFVVGCTGGPEGSVDPVATDMVDLPKSYRFAPPDVTVANGATVTWTNHDDFTHNVTFEGDDPLTMKPGETVSRAFQTPGTFPYFCSLHPNDMQGSVRVG